MIYFIISTVFALLFAAIIAYVNISDPKDSFESESPKILAIIASVIFAVIFLLGIGFRTWGSIWPFIHLLIFCYYIYEGYKTVALKTVTGVFSNISKKHIGHLEAGTHWIDPLFMNPTISADGTRNVSADLQELHIQVEETALMQTSRTGIQAKVKNISLMLEINGDITDLLNIEGGAKVVRERIVKHIEQLLLEIISHTAPEALDQDKRNTIRRIVRKIKTETNKFCVKNHYPYELIGDVIIADTELEAKYYEFLAKTEFVKLEQQAKDVEAEKLSKRIIKFGEDTLPNASEKEQKDYAIIALGIVKRDIQEKKYSLDNDLVQLAKDIALYFKKQ